MPRRLFGIQHSPTNFTDTRTIRTFPVLQKLLFIKITNLERGVSSYVTSRTVSRGRIPSNDKSAPVKITLLSHRPPYIQYPGRYVSVVRYVHRGSTKLHRWYHLCRICDRCLPIRGLWFLGRKHKRWEPIMRSRLQIWWKPSILYWQWLNMPITYKHYGGGI